MPPDVGNGEGDGEHARSGRPSRRRPPRRDATPARRRARRPALRPSRLSPLVLRRQPARAGAAGARRRRRDRAAGRPLRGVTHALSRLERCEPVHLLEQRRHRFDDPAVGIVPAHGHAHVRTRRGDGRTSNGRCGQRPIHRGGRRPLRLATYRADARTGARAHARTQPPQTSSSRKSSSRAPRGRHRIPRVATLRRGDPGSRLGSRVRVGPVLGHRLPALAPVAARRWLHAPCRRRRDPR